MGSTWETAGAYATGTGSCAPGYPTVVNAGDVLVMGCTFGNGNDTPLDTPAGFIFIPGSLEFGGDGGAYGTDSGNRGVMAFVRIADGTETGTVTVTNPGSGTTTRVTQAQIMRATKTGDAFNVRASNGEDNTDAVGYSATADDVLIPANGDLGIAVTAWNPDSATAGTPTLTWDGVANTCTQAQSIASTQGADCRLVIYRRNLAGTGGSAPVFATTASAAVTGATAFLLIHDGPAVTGQADSSFGFTATAAGVVSAPPVTGQAASAFGFTATAAGVDRAVGVAVVAFGFTSSAAGIPETFGQAASSFGFTATTNGVHRPLGAAVSAFGFTATGAGVDRAVGVVVASFGFTTTASGTVGATPVTGQGTSDFGFTAQANGVDRALGTGTSAFGFTATAAGIPATFGAVVTTLGFAATANGVVRVVGQTVAAFGFTTTAVGDSEPPREFTATILPARYQASIDGPRYVATVSARRFTADIAPARYSARIEAA